ncbi:MAG TPA: Dyp-type peroxidase [Candidatus Binataceae bacterium]|nr:Dyp-type peroxidase [Candidatus Binataceae bacterium]
MPNSDPNGGAQVPVLRQPIIQPLRRAAIFLVLGMNPDPASETAVRSICADLSALVRAVGFREPEAQLSCVMGIASEAWNRLFGSPRPADLHPFKEIIAGPRHAPATPGDLIFHIRGEREDLCFELETLILMRLGDAVTTIDEVPAFRYFDNRDLLGFVDGTENPVDDEAADAVFIGDDDPAFAGGTYVIVQKYLHDLAAWNALSTETQEKIIGRTKLADVELDDSVKPTSAHNALNTIIENGVEKKIFRANGVFGQPGKGEFGTYFIGYARTPGIIEQMLQNMFVGRPPGNYDRLLDVSRALTGTLFFVPSLSFLEAVTPASGAPAVAADASLEPSRSTGVAAAGSLGIGSLKGLSRDE